jgi:hypothetical protein
MPAIYSRVARTLIFMYALQPHPQHLCPRVLTLDGSSFFMVDDIKGNVGATRDSAKWPAFTGSQLRVQVGPVAVCGEG